MIVPKLITVAIREFKQEMAEFVPKFGHAAGDGTTGSAGDGCTDGRSDGGGSR